MDKNNFHDLLNTFVIEFIYNLSIVPIASPEASRIRAFLPSFPGESSENFQGPVLYQTASIMSIMKKAACRNPFFCYTKKFLGTQGDN
jgi:hypothetical protein